MFELNALNITLLFLSACLIGWYVLSMLGKPRLTIQFPTSTETVYVGNTRTLSVVKLQDHTNGRLLRLGVNDFYITVVNNEIKYHEMCESDALNPILRSSEDMLFFRMRVKVVGQRVVDVKQTSLSKANSTLSWNVV